MKKSLIALLLAGTATVAAADLRITEIYAGIAGNDGTADWFEVLWTGPGTFDTGTLFYDDESADPTENAALTSFILNTGDTAIFLQDSDAQGIADFLAIWGNVANVGNAAGGGGLSQGGDSVFLFDGNEAGANTVASASYDAFEGTSTIEFDAMGNGSLSVLGVNGAFASNPFFNDEIGGSTDEVTLIGSPGVIPAPASLALLGLGALAAGRRRS